MADTPYERIFRNNREWVARVQPLAVHAMVYDLRDGLLHDLSVSSDGSGAEPGAHISTWLEQWRVSEPT